MSKYIKHGILNLRKKSDKNLKNDITDILRYIYQQFPLDHKRMKKMYDHVKAPVNFDDDSDSDDDYYRWKLKFVTNPKLDDDYIYKFHDVIDIDYYENKTLIDELHNFLKKKKPEKLLLDEFDVIQLSNHKGVNDDARGVKYLDWRLHFWTEYEVDNDPQITFHDLIIGAYKVKSHKFETNYEMFCDVDYIHISVDDILTMTLRFDHGS